MTDYIKREAAINEAEKYGLSDGSVIGRHSGIADCIASEISKIPAADVAPVRRGQWNWVHRLKGGFEHYTGREANPGTEYPETYTIRRDERREVDDPYCPFCGKWNESVWLNFCPNCGADMREVHNDD